MEGICMEEYDKNNDYEDEHVHDSSYYNIDKHNNLKNKKNKQNTENEIYKSNLNNHEIENNDKFNINDFTDDLISDGDSNTDKPPIGSDDFKNSRINDENRDFIDDFFNESDDLNSSNQFIDDLSNGSNENRDFIDDLSSESNDQSSTDQIIGDLLENNNVDTKSTAKDIDLRIIVDNTYNADLLNKACENIDLNQYNISISAIIQTFNLDIAKSTTLGSDIIFIANEGGEEGKLLYNNLYDHIKTENNYIEFLQIPVNDDKELIIEELEVSIRNLIINVGLSSIFNITNFNHLKSEINTLENRYSVLENEKEKTDQLNHELKDRISILDSKNHDLNLEITDLQKTNDTLKSEFADFKTRYSNIHTKKILEIFSIYQLWHDTFNEDLEDEDKIIIATNKFKPEDIIIGQGLIGANSIDEAIDWLKVVRTALIFVEYNRDELESEIYNSKRKDSDDDNPDVGETFSNFMF